MNPKIHSAEIDSLYDAIKCIRSLDEFYDFFEDLCTIAELQAFAHRFTVAKMLSEGNTYQEIKEKTGASTVTVSRINKCISYGVGYNTILPRLKGKE